MSLLFYGILTILVAIIVVALLIVFLPGGQMVTPVVAADSIPDGLPAEGELIPDDVHRIRLPVAVRGYRMAEVDAILDRLALELERRDAKLAELEHAARPTEPPAADATPAE